MKKIIINLSNRWLYTFIAIGIILIISVGVYAWANPTTGVGHDLSEIEPCADGKILQTVEGVWTCVGMPEGGVDTRCDISGTCSQVCIGTNCQSSWPSTSVSCTLSNCANYAVSSSTGGTWTLCPSSRPVMKGLRERYGVWNYGHKDTWIDYIQCCSITCS